MDIKTDYIKTDAIKGANHLRISFYYSLGGYSYWTGENNKRGYYISVQPVSRSVSSTGFATESYIMFSGAKTLLKEVARQSKKAEAEALELFNNSEKREQLINYVLQTEGAR